MAYMNMSFDHRLLDGALADTFMSHLKRSLEHPALPELGGGAAG